MKNKDIIELLGLSDKNITITLEEEILKNMDKVYNDNIEHEKKKREFIRLFKECYDDIVKIIELDNQQRIAVNCFTCIKGMDLSKQYGKPKR